MTGSITHVPLSSEKNRNALYSVCCIQVRLTYPFLSLSAGYLYLETACFVRSASEDARF